MSSKNKDIKRRVINDLGIQLTGIESSEEREGRLAKQSLGNPFITEGSVFCFPLRSTAQESKIEVNNYNIVSLVVREDNGVLYGATSGDEDHIFFMDKKKVILDLGKVDNKKINKNSLVIAENLFLYLAATDDKNRTFILKHDTEADYINTASLHDLTPIVETDIKVGNGIFVESLFNKLDK